MPLQGKKFKIVNEGFVCENCGKEVPPTSGTTPRNHCPYCLWCKHVDINPGDRANPCHGMLRPIGIYTHSKKKYVILHQCQKCGERVRAKVIVYDKKVTDGYDLIIELSGKPIEEKKPVQTSMRKKKR